MQNKFLPHTFVFEKTTKRFRHHESLKFRTRHLVDKQINTDTSAALAQQEQEPEWVEVMVDILLSLLSQPSRHIRQVCRTVFSSICPNVTPAALNAILDVSKWLSISAESDLFNCGPIQILKTNVHVQACACFTRSSTCLCRFWLLRKMKKTALW